MVLACIVGSVIIIVAGYALFQLKATSANGRLFMWKISSMAIAESPVIGHGTESFVSAYGRAQEMCIRDSVYTSQNNVKLSALALANVEALARYEYPDVEITCNQSKHDSPGRCWHMYGECSMGWFIRYDDCRFSGSTYDSCEMCIRDR